MKWRENREIKKEQQRIAEDRTGIGEHDRGTFEGDVHPDAPTKTPEPGGWHPGVGGADSGSAQGTDTPSGHAGGWGPGAAKGGRIGYDSGGFGSYKDFIESTGDEELMELYSVGLESGDFTRLFDVLKKKGYPAEHAKGGRIGYATRGFVDENINVEGPGFDENIEMASAEGVPFMWEEFLAAKAVDPDLTYNDFLDSIDRSPSDFFGAQGGIAGLL